jgi:hypothetical protein
MPKQLKNLKVTSVDMVNADANPDAHIQLFKRREEPRDKEGEEKPVTFMQKLKSTLKIGKSSVDNPETGSADVIKQDTNQKEVVDVMKIDTSKMTPEELAQFEAIQKKYGIPDEPPPADEATGGGEGDTGGNQTGGDVAKGDVTPVAPVTLTAPAVPAPPAELHPEIKKALEANTKPTLKRLTMR